MGLRELVQYVFDKPTKVFVDSDGVYIMDEEKGIAVFHFYCDADCDCGSHDGSEMRVSEESFEKKDKDRQIFIKNCLGIVSDEDYEAYRKKRTEFWKQYHENRDRENYLELKKRFEDPDDKKD